MKKILRLYHTLKYLKQKQFFYRFYYFFRNKFRKIIKYKYPVLEAAASKSLTFIAHDPFEIYNTYENGKFTFIGITHEFKNNEIDWNDHQYGKLWNYNLTYFDYLQQTDMSHETGLKFMKDFIHYPQPIRGKRMPFPISLRNINFIKFISKQNIQDPEVNAFIFNQYNVLMDNLEYHILGNHLLENGFSLLFGAYYFQDEQLYNKAKEILTEELEEQILNDGAHYELTPMYHQIMLFRVLDCLNLVQSNDWKNKELETLLKENAEHMLGWLKNITYNNGDIPLVNDSAKGVAPTSNELFAYANVLNIKPKQLALKESGYRKKENEHYECLVDVGDIGPDYIPGHAHSDTFNFELYVQGEPIIIDTGISTYEANATRTLERSTSSHNTVEINHVNQSDVWGGFRVAKRAKIIELNEDEQTIFAVHNGYQELGFLHKRTWEFYEKNIKIIDKLNGEGNPNSIAYLHFHPNINLEIKNNILVSSLIKISFKNIDNLTLKRYNYSNNFNHKKTSDVLIINFKQTMSMEINIL